MTCITACYTNDGDGGADLSAHEEMKKKKSDGDENSGGRNAYLNFIPEVHQFKGYFQGLIWLTIMLSLRASDAPRTRPSNQRMGI